MKRDPVILVNPPLRDEFDAAFIVEELKDGSVDQVVFDVTIPTGEGEPEEPKRKPLDPSVDIELPF